MKVLMVTPTYFPIEGGTETTVRILATKLNKMGIHTDVMTFNKNQQRNPIWREETEDNGMFRVFRVPAFDLSCIFRINPLELLGVHTIPKPSFAKKFEDYDIIHFHVGVDMAFPFFSYFVRKPKIFHHHGSIARFPRLKNLFKFIFPRLADLYIAINIKLLSDLGVPRSKSLAFYSVWTLRLFDRMKRKDLITLFCLWEE